MISIIIPYWNAEEWIGRCISSLKAQDGDMEFILVNDSSTDDGKKIAKELIKGDKRFRHYENAHEKGVSGARNTGIDKAKGEWITFLDADDELLSEASKIFGHMIWLDETANVIQANHLRHYVRTNSTKLKYANERGVYRLIELPFSRWPKCWCMVWNKLYRRSFIEENHIRFIEGLQYGEDEMFNLEVCRYDDRLFHTKSTTVTVMRHFDNRQSLSKVKAHDWKGLTKQSQTLEEFLLQTDDEKLRHSVYEIIAEHWTSGRYQEAFGAK